MICNKITVDMFFRCLVNVMTFVQVKTRQEYCSFYSGFFMDKERGFSLCVYACSNTHAGPDTLSPITCDARYSMFYHIYNRCYLIYIS